ncbi:hypothetical protein MSAN_00924000 [Mycena sanguinolenta]|uniref:Uncharacterized protein n=1 Tax=Mycena sanguinolenta TaxID=230812 RepID=A0A8H6YXK9_9AGAR|nr:hypothetical protein MSAN_00924000 [Mycena sanguinolenta]
MVATTRAPGFAEDTYRDPSNGFRELGPYLSLSSVVPSLEFDDSADVPAAAAIGPGATKYFAMWSAMLVTPQSHFILIFMITETPLLPSLLLPSEHDMLSESYEPFIDFLPVSHETGLETPVFSSSHSSSSSVSASPARSSHRQSRSSSPYSAPPKLPVANAVLAVARAKIPDFDSLQLKAKSIGKGNKSTPLASLGRCYSAMERILVQLGFDPQNPRSVKPLSFTLDGKTVEFTAEAVFDCCRWSSGTFNTKRKRYNLAKSIAHQDHDTTELHQIFLGIKFLWGENGPFTLLDIPLPSSEAEGSEKFTANLRQAHLDKLVSSTQHISDKNTALPT